MAASGPHSSEEDDGPAPESSPEEARQKAEEALARIEDLADLDDDPDAETEPSTEGGAEVAGEEAAAPGADSGPIYATGPPTSEDVPPEDQCENCGALLHGPYCSQCGQKAADRIVPIWHMINEALEAVVELDLRVLHTMPKFLFLPGRLTKEYLSGRRKRYIRPFRLYLFSTFLLFTTLALTTTGGFGLPFPPATATVPADTAQAAVTPADTAAAGAPVSVGETEEREKGSTGNGSIFGPQRQREEMARRIEEDTSAVQVNNVFDDPATNARLERTIRQNLPEILRHPWEFIGSIIDRGPYVMFLMLPIFALLLKLLYIRRGRLYVEHLIFSLHVHAHAFFAFTVGILLGESDIGWLNTLGVWVELSPLLYLILAMGHVYEQGLIKSTIKAFILLTIYSIILVLGFIGLAIVAFFLV